MQDKECKYIVVCSVLSDDVDSDIIKA